MDNQTIPVSEKYILTINEASQYFNIGSKKIRRLGEDNIRVFALYNGNRCMIIRKKFEEYLQKATSI